MLTYFLSFACYIKLDCAFKKFLILFSIIYFKLSIQGTGMNSLTGVPKLTIKAANQKFNDFVIDNFDLDWSVMRLKQYLHLNYPNNPVF